MQYKLILGYWIRAVKPYFFVDMWIVWEFLLFRYLQILKCNPHLVHKLQWASIHVSESVGFSFLTSICQNMTRSPLNVFKGKGCNRNSNKDFGKICFVLAWWYGTWALIGPVCTVYNRCSRTESPPDQIVPLQVNCHKDHYNAIQVYSVITHVIALEAGQSSQGTFEPITPAYRLCPLFNAITWVITVTE